MGDAFVTAQHPAGFIHKVAGDVLLPRVPPDEGRIVPVGDEADVLTVRLPGVEKALPVCQRPHFRLMQNAQRELGVGQLLLGQHIEDIALILAEIHRFFQEIPAVLPLDPGIVAGGDGVAAHQRRPVIEPPELQIAVAVNAGVGGLPPLVGRGEAVHDLTAEFVGEIEHIVGHIQLVRHAAGVLHILQRAAGAAAGDADVLVAVQRHGSADAVPPLLLHEGSGDAGINAAAHCNQYPFHQTMGQPPSQCSQSGNLL